MNEVFKGKIIPRIGLMVTVHPFEDGADNAELLKKALETKLTGLEAEIVTLPCLIKDRISLELAAKEFISKDIDVICLVEATWSNDDLLLDLLEMIDRPVIVWGIPDVTAGSVCGGQQVCCVLFELGKKYKFLHGGVEKTSLYKELESYARVVALSRRLRKAKFLMIDYRVSGMTEIAFDEFALKSELGPRVIQIPYDILNLRTEKVSYDKVNSVLKNIKDKYGSCSANQKDLFESIKKYIALKELMEEEGIEGVSFRCYPYHMGEICLAFSLLSDEGYVCGCEGDINAVAAMYIVKSLTGKAVHNTDFLHVYENENSILYAHCGAAGFSLAGDKKEISLERVRLANKGLCVLFPAHPGNVTLLNLVGRAGTYRMGIITGEAVNTEMVFAGNPVKVKFDIKYEDILAQTADKGLGHHWMIGYGNIESEIEELAKLIKMSYYKYKEL